MAPSLSFAEWLRRCRGVLGLTQEAFAELLGYAVVTYRKVEQGERPSIEFARKLVCYLELPEAEHAAFVHYARTGVHPHPLQLLPRLPYLAEPEVAQPRSRPRLLGRELDLRRLLERLDQPDTRLVTLTGPGGVGKTSLALAAVSDLAARFADGCVVVSLAAVADPELVAGAIAQQLHLPVGEDQAAQLVQQLAPRTLLLVLDNVEHVLGSAALLRQLLLGAPGVKLLATSRVPLQLDQEHVLVVAPLPVPEQCHGASTTLLAQFPSVQLLLERARATDPDLQLTQANGAAVAGICRMLDGLPLALELAAARLRLFSPQQLQERLYQQLLADPQAGLAQRHQSLGAVIAWSYTLLSPAEQRLFRRMSIFAGSCTIEALEAVCADSGDGYDGLSPSQPAAQRWPAREPRTSPGWDGPALSADALPCALGTLLDHHLLQRVAGRDGAPRFVMLETIRAYAYQQLQRSGELELVRRRQIACCLALAEQAEPAMLGPDQESWCDRLEEEYANLRRVMQWVLEAEDYTTALWLGALLWRFWSVRGPLADGHRYLAQALGAAGASQVPVGVRAKALHGIGALACQQGDYLQARIYYEECLVLWRAVGDRAAAARSLQNLSRCLHRIGELERARAACEEGLTLGRELGDRAVIAQALNALGQFASQAGDDAQAYQLFEESLAYWRAMGATFAIAAMLNNMGEISRKLGRYAQSRALFEEGLALCRELGDKNALSLAYVNLGSLANDEHDYQQACAYAEACLRLQQELGNKLYIADALYTLADARRMLGMPAHATRLYATASRLYDQIGSVDEAAERSTQAQVRARVAPLDEPSFMAAWTIGWGMGVEEALALALNPPPSACDPDQQRRAVDLEAGVEPLDLTPREQEIAALISRGLTNRAIAERLAISPCTVNSHVRRIFDKAKVTSRVELSQWLGAAALGLPCAAHARPEHA